MIRSKLTVAHLVFDERNSFQMFKLRSGAVECDENGLRVHGVSLLVSNCVAKRYSWTLPDDATLESNLKRAYGLQIEIGSKREAFCVIVDALNVGDLARAQVATLLMKLPDPLERKPQIADMQFLAKRFEAGGWSLKDWDPDKHPRTGAAPNPGWFAPTGSGSDSSGDTSHGGSSGSQRQSEIIPICTPSGVSIATDEYGNKLSTCYYECYGGVEFKRTYRGGGGCPIVRLPRY